MGLELERFSYDDNSGGVDLKSSPTKVEEDTASYTLNMDYSTDGAALTRFGSSRQNSTQCSQLRGLGMYDYKKSDGTQVQVIQQGSELFQGLTTLTPFSPPENGKSTILYPDMEFMVTPDNEYLIWGNGTDTNRKFDGVTWTNLSITTPGDPTVSIGGAGTLTGDFAYYIAFVRYDVLSNTIQQLSDLNPNAQLITATADSVNITRPASPDTQVNGWVIYRQSPTSLGVFYQVVDSSDNPVIIPIATTTYTDNQVDDGTLEAEFDNQPAPSSAIFESFQGRMYYANGADLVYSKPDLPWNVPTFNDSILDGPINCIVKAYNVLIISTSNGTMWYLPGDIESFDPQRISGDIGILNNRCASGDAQLYIMATNKKVYYFRPTDFEQGQLRVNQPLSIKVDPFMETILTGSLDRVSLRYYSKANVGKVMISCPTTSAENDKILIYNETQSQQKEKPCWQIWDNLNVAAMQMFNLNGVLDLYSSDYNGFVWKLNDQNLSGDGAEINGTVTAAASNSLTQLLLTSTATSATANTLSDTNVDFTLTTQVGDYITITSGTGSGQSRSIIVVSTTQVTVNLVWTTTPDNTSVFTIGQFNPGTLQGITVRIVSGTGSGQNQTILSNTNTTLTFSTNWLITPDSTSVYSVGSYVSTHFVNWKSVTGSYDTLKQLWYMIPNLNAGGNYNIQLIIQVNYDTSLTNQTNLLINLSALNSIWGSVTWGQFPWGSFSVFQDLKKINKRFYAIRFGFQSSKSGQPFQLNRFGLAAQDKGLFYKAQ